jgi:DNA-binding NtrC family response regulator
MRILIVDDEDALLFTLAANLELEGMEVEVAESGARALELLEAGRFDLMLTDIRMPGMDGVELFRRARVIAPEMPVLMMTAFAVEHLIDEAVAEGVFSILPKPFAIEHALAAIHRAERRPIVLVVDQPLAEAELVAAQLREVGHRAEATQDAAHALELVGSGRVDVFVASLAAGGAADLVTRVVATDPSIACVVLLARPAPDLLRRVAALIVAAVPKPVASAELLRVIAQARAAPFGPRSIEPRR